MYYDVIEGGEVGYDSYEFFTIGRLIELCLEHPWKTFKFLGTDYTVGVLHSWRGSYELPAISYEAGDKTGAEISRELRESLCRTHYGWKGGEYKYTLDDEFYVSNKGCSDEYKVQGYRIEGDHVILLTKLDPY